MFQWKIVFISLLFSINLSRCNSAQTDSECKVKRGIDSYTFFVSWKKVNNKFARSLATVLLIKLSDFINSAGQQLLLGLVNWWHFQSWWILWPSNTQQLSAALCCGGSENEANWCLQNRRVYKKISVSTVWNVIKKWQLRRTVEVETRSARTRKLSDKAAKASYDCTTNCRRVTWSSWNKKLTVH